MAPNITWGSGKQIPGSVRAPGGRQCQVPLSQRNRVTVCVCVCVWGGGGDGFKEPGHSVCVCVCMCVVVPLRGTGSLGVWVGVVGATGQPVRNVPGGSMPQVGTGHSPRDLQERKHPGGFCPFPRRDRKGDVWLGSEFQT